MPQVGIATNKFCSRLSLVAWFRERSLGWRGSKLLGGVCVASVPVPWLGLVNVISFTAAGLMIFLGA